MIPQRSDEWLVQRRGRVTASLVGAILGVAPYMTREQALRAMVRDTLGAPREFTGNVATEWGVYNEEGAIFEYEMVETGRKVKKSGFIPYEDWAGCSPDGLIGDKGGLEVKCPYGIRNDPHPVFKSLEEQPHYYAQVQFSLFVTGREWWDFFQWTPHGTKLEWASVDHEWLDENIPRLRQFYAEYLDALKSPEEHLEPLRVSIDTVKASLILDEYDQLSAAIDNATERRKELLGELVKMAGVRNAKICGRKLTQVQKEGAISYAKAIKELAPDADLEPYRGKPSSYWRIA